MPENETHPLMNLSADERSFEVTHNGKKNGEYVIVNIVTGKNVRFITSDNEVIVLPIE